MINEKILHHRIVERLGGGMGVVYKAEPEALQRGRVLRARIRGAGHGVNVLCPFPGVRSDAK